jgi:H+/Na+-translocating ferredoxin:NAD+ oxidoreductase subunit G
MKEIVKIVLSLTVVCVAAALILGAVFAKTQHIRKANEMKEREETIQSLLGYGAGTEKPADLKIVDVYRYVITDDKGTTVLGYLLPLKEKGFALVEIDLSGKPGKVIPVKAEPAQVAELSSRDAAIKAALPKGSKATYAETLSIADLGDKRLGYVVPGVTQGFKTFIKFMVSLNPDFTVTGVAITEAEEDPGLGAEIHQDYFKNQFIGKTANILKKLTVIKKPLPTDYLDVLEPAKAKKLGLTKDQIREIKQKHAKDDIYALTGATISSRAMTTGVKNTVRKFVYRLDILTGALKQDNIRVAF